MKEGAPGALRGAHVAVNRAAVRLVTRLEQRFAVRHAWSRSWLSSRASRAPRPNRRSGVSAPERAAHQAPLFLVEGDGESCLDLVRRLGEQQPSYALVAPVVDGLRRTIEDRAEASLGEVRRLAPRGPYLLGGVATGGQVALEMARRVRARGEHVPLLLMLDTWGPNYPVPLPTTFGWQHALYQLFRRVEHHVGALCLHERERRLAYLHENGTQAIDELSEALAMLTAGRGDRSNIGEPLTPAVKRDPAPRPYAGRLVLVRSTAQPLGIQYDRTMGWGEVVRGGIDVIECPGRHGAMAADPWARVLADKLRPVLACAQREASSSVTGRPRGPLPTA